MRGTFKDLTGTKFGRLTVTKRLPNNKFNMIVWECLCDCGNIHNVSANCLLQKQTFSCGCQKKESVSKACKTHGKSRTKLHKVWISMRGRCNNHNDKNYNHYGDRGISVCEEWDTYKCFYDWSIKNGYIEGLQIDRINNDGNYCPENCAWVTSMVNMSHTSRSNHININGEIKCLSEWSRIMKANPPTFWRWFRKGKKYCAIKFSERLNKEIYFIENKYIILD